MPTQVDLLKQQTHVGTKRFLNRLHSLRLRPLIESLKQEKWRSVLYSDDVNIAYANFINTFNTLYNVHCPTKNVKIKDSCRKNPG